MINLKVVPILLLKIKLNLFLEVVLMLVLEVMRVMLVLEGVLVVRLHSSLIPCLCFLLR